MNNLVIKYSIPASYCFIVAATIYGGTQPHVGSIIPISEQVYPTKDVLYYIAIVSIETLTLWLIIRPNTFKYSWGRSLIGLVVFLGLWVYWGQYVMHNPEYYYYHMWWLSAVVLVLSIVLIWVLGSILMKRITSNSKRRKNPRA